VDFFSFFRRAEGFFFFFGKCSFSPLFGALFFFSGAVRGESSFSPLSRGTGPISSFFAGNSQETGHAFRRVGEISGFFFLTGRLYLSPGSFFFSSRGRFFLRWIDSALCDSPRA